MRTPRMEWSVVQVRALVRDKGRNKARWVLHRGERGWSRWTQDGPDIFVDVASRGKVVPQVGIADSWTIRARSQLTEWILKSLDGHTYLSRFKIQRNTETGCKSRRARISHSWSWNWSWSWSSCWLNKYQDAELASNWTDDIEGQLKQARKIKVHIWQRSRATCLNLRLTQWTPGNSRRDMKGRREMDRVIRRKKDWALK
jgi:hypothetical protein